MHDYTVTPDLSETGLSENLIYRTVCCESILRVQFTLIYPTPGLSDTFYTWSNKRGPTVYYN